MRQFDVAWLMKRGKTLAVSVTDKRGEGMLSNYDAVGIAEGFVEAESEEQVIEAWQQLHDTGLAYQLQGWFGRTAKSMIEAGLINE
jgi:hypothetical protein